MNVKNNVKTTLSLLLALPLLLLCACSPTKPEKVNPDVIHLAAVTENAGYVTQYYSEGSSALSALAEEMEGTLGKSLKGQILGYLFARDGKTGTSTLELFIFEKAADATLLYNHLKDQDTFVEGETECRIDCTVVYMGYISALERVEGTVIE